MTGLAGVKVTAAPVVGVSWTPLTETLKERIDGLAGSLSATSVTLTVAAPPCPQLTLQAENGPLQEVRNKTTSERVEKKEKALLRII